MIRWLLQHVFVWSVRIGFLLAAVLTVQHILVEELGYRMEFKPMLVVALLMIVTVRIWMPWPERQSKHDLE